MSTPCAERQFVWPLLCVIFVTTSAQQDSYSFRHVPEEELVPLAAAYGRALDAHAAGNWTEAVRYLELSLRLRRLLRDSVRHCARLCDRSAHDESPLTRPHDLRVFWRVLMSASCQRRCRTRFPALRHPPPSREVLEDFSRRSPYKYLHHAYSKLDNLQRAVPCAFTFLQKNPDDQEMRQLLEGYEKEYDLSGFLVDQEEQPHEASFVRGVKLVSSGDYGSSVGHLEEALRLYLQEFDLCQASCEAVSQVLPHQDFYTLIAEVYVDTLKCRLRCEEDLMPNVGGYFVENFVATIYHYLQYAYYKLNDGHRAVPCAYSYFLFDPEDNVMKQNMRYYEAYGEQWGLQSDHFTPRTEAVKYYNYTNTQKQMLRDVEIYMKQDDEDFFGLEEAALLASESPDGEFEGIGDYEESIYANWRQPKGKGDSGESDI